MAKKKITITEDTIEKLEKKSEELNLSANKTILKLFEEIDDLKKQLQEQKQGFKSKKWYELLEPEDQDKLRKMLNEDDNYVEARKKYEQENSIFVQHQNDFGYKTLECRNNMKIIKDEIESFINQYKRFFK